ncbi:Related to stress protein ORP150 [Taphrina deformans PYCC 5710]|uniref:Related to stress protein ORP150 n=1 Tax=Taphrina deformans (strain PYCC 5710 / ATCC 11124 / CBS 356.35 / IMI 108563 / JCM 9778 / NBRC 8474) TaxID=1097556 RepID=R4X9X3_TAPDE|nr:Related to stress protein ORP150 [Taphrina deformans PYCC 5710]|eukprot:CCG81029.1 Related to stress protein ORP150 [Taphrina deformans PYCC 5710]
MRLPSVHLLLWHAASAAVLSIDYGTEWTKAALVKPGIPLEIVLTKDTKRKEQSVIAFKGEERLYGGDAANMGARIPQYTYPALKSLLGKSYDSKAVKEYNLLYPAVKLSQTAQNGIAVGQGAETFTVEELVAMEFINMRKNAELMASGEIRDAVLTVPPFFDHRQRAALLTAAELANLRPLELLNDGLAVAMDYAKSRTFDQPQIHAIFDVGAGSTSATIVRFSSASVKDVGRLNKTVTTIEVLGTEATDRVSGNVMSERIFHHLVEEFDTSKAEKASSSVKTNPRALARLLKEATRVKQVLSANNEAAVSVESLHDDLDFRYKITRTTFERLTSDLGTVTTEVVAKALTIAKTAVSEIDSLILHGGAARVPFVQKALLDVVAESQIARNVNADEAAVMGAVFRGAGLSGSFRVKELQIRDVSAIRYSYEQGRTRETLFEQNTSFGTTKNITLPNVDADFEIIITSDMPQTVQAAQEVANFAFQDVSNSVNSFVKKSGCQAADLVITFILNYSGIATIHDASVVCEVDDRPGVADKLKGWFGSKESATAKDTGEKGKTVTENAEDEPPKKLQKSKRLSYVSSNTAHSLQHNEKELSLGKIAKYEKFDNQRIALQTARNGLEAYIYKVRDLLENDGFQQVSSDREREDLKALAAAANEWIYDEGESATLDELVSKKKAMTDISDKVLFRKQESGLRQQKIDALQKQLSSARKFIKTQSAKIAEYASKVAENSEKAKRDAATKKSNSDEDDNGNEEQEITDTGDSNSSNTTKDDEIELPEPVYSETELTNLGDKLDRNEKWLSIKIAEQAALGSAEDPALLTADLEKRTSRITEDFMYLLRKATYAEQSKTKSKPKQKSSTVRPKTKTSASAQSASSQKDAASKATRINSQDAPEPSPAVTPSAGEQVADPSTERNDPVPEAAPVANDEKHDEL